MTTDHVIDISTVGDIESLYNDKVGVMDMGEVSMCRASNIVFNEATKSWDILPTCVENLDKLPFEYFGWSSYDEAIKFEVAMFNEARKIGILNNEGLCGDLGHTTASAIYSKL